MTCMLIEPCAMPWVGDLCLNVRLFEGVKEKKSEGRPSVFLFSSPRAPGL